MHYVFEKGQYPNHTEVDAKEFPSDAEAIVHAEVVGADYVWGFDEESNPTSVWRRGQKEAHVEVS